MTKKHTVASHYLTLAGFLEQVFIEHGADALVKQMAYLHGHFVVTSGGRVLAANPEFAGLLDYVPEEIKGMMAVDLVVPEDRDDLAQRFAQNIIERYPLRLLSKNGEKRFVTVAPHLFYVSGKPYRLAHFVDNTELINIQREQIVNFRNTASALSHAIEQRDPYTSGHMSRTADLARRIAKHLQLTKSEIETIVLGAGLHDIGKISVPIEILTKPGKLENHEWTFIKKHPEIGLEILSDVQFDQAVKDVVLLHHERHDSSGYPYGLSGSEIPIEAAIVGIADCLEAISGVRPYRKENTLEEAVEIMEMEREKHHKELLKIARHLVFEEKIEKKSIGLET